jgi:tRNA pseudouridine32 synthase/23S rRNA pseudouridine746 synthase
MLHYIDEHLLVLEKPAGLLSVPGRGPDKAHCLATLALQWAPDALVVHRLDMATSGLVVMARGSMAQLALNKAFASREVDKLYHAVVHGLTPYWADSLLNPDDWHEINLPLIADWPNRPLQKVDWEVGKSSTTQVQWLGLHGAPGQSRVALRPITGRSHQLRVHLMSFGHAIVGDALYAPSGVAPLPFATPPKHAPALPEATSNPLSADADNGAQPRLLLHACRLALDHPATGQPLVFESRTPFF